MIKQKALETMHTRQQQLLLLLTETGDDKKGETRNGQLNLN